jgi:RNA polymerase sigma factor (sigma-70 family)
VSLLPRDDFERFYEAARDDCLRTVYASTRDLPLAEDLVAEAFARAWARWSRVSSHPAPRAWIVRTALNAHISAWRRRRRDLPWMHPASDERSAPDVGATSIDGDLLSAIHRLPERQQQVLALRVFLDLDTATTAELLHIAPGTASAHLARAIAHLREELVPTTRMEG